MGYSATLIDNEIKKDHEQGLTYRELAKKYRKSPRDLVKILEGPETKRPYSVEPRFSISEKSKIIIFDLALKWGLLPDLAVERLYKEWNELSTSVASFSSRMRTQGTN